MADLWYTFFMDLSIIIPAYNEEKQLPLTMKRVLEFLTQRYKGTFELIVIDDGSDDGTGKSVEAFISQYATVRLVRVPQHKGRGVAVRQGIGMAHGELILEMDAGGGVDAEAIVRFAEYMNNHPDVGIIIGSRNIEGSCILPKQPLLRVVREYIFFILAWVLFGWDFRDRVNGFKMFRKQAANDMFAFQHETGFLAEAELVVIAECRKWKYELLPVQWTECRDSWIHPSQESWRSLRGIFDIFRRARRGGYSRKTS